MESISTENQLFAEHNMQICLPTTPAQMFHMLRRQVIRPLRKPLIVLTPKSLLRHKLAVSALDDLTAGQFHTVLDEIDAVDPGQVDRLVLCSGKIYYDLLEQRRKEGAENIAIVRLEQLYPFPERDLGQVIAPLRNIKDVVWCQEEPMNQGAWYSSQHHIRRVILDHNDKLYLSYAGREGFAATAGGYVTKHIERQQRLIREALFD
jgi:2-oxoglutarate dehydrogenase E1 component